MKFLSDGKDISVSTELLQSGLFVPVSEVKAMRRKAVAALLEGTKKHEKDRGVSQQW